MPQTGHGCLARWDREVKIPTVLVDWFRCTMIKVSHPKRERGPVLLLQNYPHPLSLRGRGPYHFPTPLNTWAPSTWPPSSLLVFPLKSKKKHKIGINLKFEMLYNYWELKWEKYLLNFLLKLSVIHYIWKKKKTIISILIIIFKIKM